MLPELPRLSSLRSGFLPPALAVDDTDGLRRMVRFVWTSATLVGVCGRARRAAAAAAEDSDLFWFWPEADMKAAAAAVEALGLTVAMVSGCEGRR